MARTRCGSGKDGNKKVDFRDTQDLGMDLLGIDERKIPRL